MSVCACVCLFFIFSAFVPVCDSVQGVFTHWKMQGSCYSDSASWLLCNGINRTSPYWLDVKSDGVCACVCVAQPTVIEHLPWLLWGGSLTLVLLSGCLLSRAMAAQLVVALLALTSLGAASEPDCKELVKPLVLDSHSPVSISHHLLSAGPLWHSAVCQ